MRGFSRYHRKSYTPVLQNEGLPTPKIKFVPKICRPKICNISMDYFKQVVTVYIEKLHNLIVIHFDLLNQVRYYLYIQTIWINKHQWIGKNQKTHIILAGVRVDADHWFKVHAPAKMSYY